MIRYVLTHEYSDSSGFAMCGITENRTVAEAWYRGSDTNNVYAIQPECIEHWLTGHEGWKQRERAERAAKK